VEHAICVPQNVSCSRTQFSHTVGLMVTVTCQTWHDWVCNVLWVWGCEWPIPVCIFYIFTKNWRPKNIKATNI